MTRDFFRSRTTNALLSVSDFCWIKGSSNFIIGHRGLTTKQTHEDWVDNIGTDFIGFLGFAYFIRYFWVNPDELFLLTLRRAATGAFILEVALFPLLMLARYLTAPTANPIPFALGLSFAASIIVFCLYHTWLEWREMRGLE